jgi:hypothetical protein
MLGRLDMTVSVYPGVYQEVSNDMFGHKGPLCFLPLAIKYSSGKKVFVWIPAQDLQDSNINCAHTMTQDRHMSVKQCSRTGVGGSCQRASRNADVGTHAGTLALLDECYFFGVCDKVMLNQRHLYTHRCPYEQAVYRWTDFAGSIQNFSMALQQCEIRRKQWKRPENTNFLYIITKIDDMFINSRPTGSFEPMTDVRQPVGLYPPSD